MAGRVESRGGGRLETGGDHRRAEDLTKEELQKRAVDAGIKGRSTMSKDELVKALAKAEPDTRTA